MTGFRGFAAQTRHYFDRAQQGLPPGPLAGPSIWRGVQLRERTEQWRFELSAGHCAELATALGDVRKRKLPMTELARDDFHLPELTDDISNWRRQIEDGLGFVVVGGLPVNRFSEEDLALVFWGIGHHLGIPGAQNPDQELLGHVRDYHEADASVRLYRTARNINFHCDAADVVGLLCLHKAVHGGQSRIVSSGLLYNECLARAPGAAARLFLPLERQLLDIYDAVAADPDNYLDMDLQPGDMQFLSNHTIAHARTAYQDDPENPRHLLRLWLSLDQG